MTTYQFRKWALTEGLADSWWLLLDGVTEPETLSMDEIEERLSLGDYAEVQVLHASQAEVEPAPWATLHVSADRIEPPAYEAAYPDSDGLVQPVVAYAQPPQVTVVNRGCGSGCGSVLVFLGMVTLLFVIKCAESV